MKIKITMNVPVDPAHGIKIGNVYDVLPEEEDKRGWWIMGELCEKVKILPREAEVVKE